MRKINYIIMTVVLFCLSVGLYGCLDDSNPIDPGIAPEGTKILVANSLGETLSRFTFQSGAYVSQNDIAPTGQAPNQILVKGNTGYVLNSLSNSVLALDLETLSVHFEASVGGGKSPYNMAFINNDEMLVTNFMANDCVRLNIELDYPDTNRVTETITLPSGTELLKDSGVLETMGCPQAVVIVDHKAFVTLANLNNLTFTPGGPGLVAMINLDSNQVQSVIETTGRNTVGLCRDPHIPNQLYFLSAGDIDPETFEYLANGKIDIFNLTTNGIIDGVDVNGAPAEMVVAQNHFGYITDNMSGTILTYDTIARRMGASINLVPYGDLSYASGLVLGPNNLLFAIEFNSDALVIIDIASGNKIVDRLTTGDGPDAVAVVY